MSIVLIAFGIALFTICLSSYLSPVTPTYEGAYKTIAKMRAANMVHRSGIKLKDMRLSYLIERVEDEVEELKESIEEGHPELNELCDVMNILVHIAIINKWTPEMIAETMDLKMMMRFHHNHEGD